MARHPDETVGRTRRRTALKAAAALALVLAAAVLFLWSYLVQKNFDTVVPGKIYRSGQPGAAQLEEWIAKYRLRTIVVLKPTLRPYEQALAQKHGLNLHHIVVSTKKGLPESQWQQIRQIVTDERNFPLLLHCHSGADKTGVVTALYRVEVQGWPLWRALAEMDLHGHIPFQYPALQRYLKDRFRPRPDEPLSAVHE
ncbi:MAG: tyrosine-protein phosphatase [bacterium]